MEGEEWVVEGAKHEEEDSGHRRGWREMDGGEEGG